MKQKPFGNYLKQEGYERVDFEAISDVYIINTCTVTNTGDKKSRQVIRRAIRKNPDAVICVTGCYAQTSPAEIMAYSWCRYCGWYTGSSKNACNILSNIKKNASRLMLLVIL